MLTIWLGACGPYGGESSAICKRSGAIALPPESPPCNQGDRWRGYCCGLVEEIKITFNKLWLEWARAPAKSQFVSQTVAACCISEKKMRRRAGVRVEGGVMMMASARVFHIFHLTAFELWSFSSCPRCSWPVAMLRENEEHHVANTGQRVTGGGRNPHVDKLQNQGNKYETEYTTETIQTLNTCTESEISFIRSLRQQHKHLTDLITIMNEIEYYLNTLMSSMSKASSSLLLLYKYQI